MHKQREKKAGGEECLKAGTEQGRKEKKGKEGVASWYDVYDTCTAMEEFENISLL